MARGKNQPLTEKDLLAGLAKLNKKPEELGFKKPLRNILGEAQGAATQSAKLDTSGMDNTERLRQMATAIQGKISVERGTGATNETIARQNATVFESFINQSKKRDELLQTATEEQQEIYKDLEKTLADLAQANTHDSKELRKTLAVLSGKLSTTDPTKARENINNLLQDARANAEPASFGRAFKALVGSERKTREGYVREGNKYRNLESGRYAGKAEATHGRLGSAFGFASETLGNRIQQDIDKERDAKDAFSRSLRWLSGMDSEKKRTKLGEYQGRIAGLQAGGKGGGGGILGGGKAGTGNATPAAGPMNLEGAIVNITAKELKSKTDKASVTANSVELSGELENDMQAEAGGDGTPFITPIGGGKRGPKPTGKSVGKGFLKSAAVGAIGYGADLGGEYLKGHGHETAGKAVSTIGSTAEYAGMGGAAGTVIGGAIGLLGGPAGMLAGATIGNRLGTGAGALIGAGKGIYDNYGDDIKKYAMEKLGLATAEGKNENPLTDLMQSMTNTNETMKAEQATKPMVVPSLLQSTPQAPDSRNPSPSVVLPRANVRPDESYLERYTNRHSMYY